MVLRKKPDRITGILESAYNYRPSQRLQIPKFPPAIRARGSEEVLAEPENPLEPRSFSEFIGQDRAKEVLSIIVDSANKEHRIIPNILLTGPYGHGKTTLAKLIVRRHKKDVRIVDGASTDKLLLDKPSKGTIYIIDEAHNIPTEVTDSFNIQIDSGNLRVIACTTNPGALPAPFRSRFRSIYLHDYTPVDLERIVFNALLRSKQSATHEAIQMIAARSKLNPRQALTILEFSREVRVLRGDREITADDLREVFYKLDIDDRGLTALDQKYLSLLKYDTPVGLQFISSILSVDRETIQEEIEPYLIHLGLVERTPRGRKKPLPNDIQSAVEATLNRLIGESALAR